MQPLWGHAFGKKDETELRTDFRAEMEIHLAASAVIYVILAVFRMPVVTLYYSTKQTWKSNIIAVSRGIVIKAAAIFLVPVIFGTSWVWASAAVAKGVTLIIIEAIPMLSADQYPFIRKPIPKAIYQGLEFIKYVISLQKSLTFFTINVMF